jgi:murein L,D-transpeptidase YcbB/YkuD
MKMDVRRLWVTAMIVAGVVAGAGAGVNLGSIPDRGDDDQGLHLVLNVAGNRLDVYENGERTKTYRVSVGLPGYETPAGEYRIQDVIWNPWWHPPNSEWARGRTPTAPGDPENPMGRVKLNFAPLLYIHGTPDRASLGQPASRGCVRMRNEDAIELAKLIHGHASPNVEMSLLDRLIGAPTQTRRIVLARPVRFTANYTVAAVNDGFLIIYPDIYGLVGRQLRDQVELVLEEHGVNPREVNQERLGRLLEKGPSRRVAMSLDSLVAPSGPHETFRMPTERGR